MPTFAEGLAELLRTGRFTEITLDQWEAILLSIIVEDLEAEAAYKHQKTPVWMEYVPRVHFTIVLGLPTRDSSEMSAAVRFFEDTLPTAARLMLSAALTRFVWNAYKVFKDSNYENEQAKTLAVQGLSISSLLDGVIRADVLEEIALDPKFPNRQAAVGNLLNQNFQNSVPPSFWKKLEGQVSWAPELAPYMMQHHLDRGREFEALCALKHVPMEPEGNIIRLIEKALEEMYSYGGWQDNVRNVFADLPPWVLESVRKDVELNPIFQEVLDLLEPSPI